MTGETQTKSLDPAAFADVTVPVFVTITDVTPDGALEPEFVITNEATGRYFLANRATVQFFAALKDSGSVPLSLARTRIDANQGKRLVQQLFDHGVLTRVGETQTKQQTAKAPIESKMISIRWDLVDASRLTERFRGLGRLLYSPLGYFLWVLAMVMMAFELLANREKVGLTLAQIFDASWTQWLLFAGLFVALKAIHEMGHALAYQDMCRQEDLKPGPIRMGICIFAMSPFPFTDVTGAWRLRARWRRIMIGAGGIYFETWIMAFLTLFWAQTQSGLLQTVILQVAVIAGALTLLFNLNPAVKLDGYFMLTDYLRRPNLAARASNAARTFFARRLGADTPAPNGGELGYWVLSYAYRWSIFAGIFWIAYQFDKRVAPVVLIMVIMMLVIRPLITSLRHAFKLGIRPLKAGLVALCVAGLIALMLIPLPNWQRVPGQLIRYETRFLEPLETGQLTMADDGTYQLQNPSLDQQITDTSLRLEMMENLKRARFASAEEQARLTGEIARFADSRDTLIVKRASLTAPVSETAVWTALDSRWLEGAWVRPGNKTKLAAISEPTTPHLRLRLDQALLDQDMDLTDQTRVQVRSHHDPGCLFFATIQVDAASLLAVDGVVLLKAEPAENLPGCAGELRHGAALVARLDAAPASLFKRARLAGARLLQDRLLVDPTERQQ